MKTPARPEKETCPENLSKLNLKLRNWKVQELNAGKAHHLVSENSETFF